MNQLIAGSEILLGSIWCFIRKISEFITIAMVCAIMGAANADSKKHPISQSILVKT